MRTPTIIFCAGLLAATGVQAETPAPSTGAPPAISCDDAIINAQLKLQQIIDADKKAAAFAHIRLAQDAIAKEDAASCHAHVRQAMDIIK